MWCFVCACSLHRSLLLRALAFAAFRRPLIVCTVDYSAALLAVRACETRSLAAAFAIKLCRFGGSSAAPRSRAPWLRPFFFSLFLACALRRVTRRLDNPGARARRTFLSLCLTTGASAASLRALLCFLFRFAPPRSAASSTASSAHRSARLEPFYALPAVLFQPNVHGRWLCAAHPSASGLPDMF